MTDTDTKEGNTQAQKVAEAPEGTEWHSGRYYSAALEDSRPPGRIGRVRRRFSVALNTLGGRLGATLLLVGFLAALAGFFSALAMTAYSAGEQSERQPQAWQVEAAEQQEAAAAPALDENPGIRPATQKAINRGVSELLDNHRGVDLDRAESAMRAGLGFAFTDGGTFLLTPDGNVWEMPDPDFLDRVGSTTADPVGAP